MWYGLLCSALVWYGMVWYGMVWYVWIVLGPKAYGMMGQRGKDRRLGVESQASSWRSRGRGSEIHGVEGCESRDERDQNRSDKRVSIPDSTRF